MTRRSTPAVLTATGLTVRFGGTVAVDALDLQVRRGEVVGLVGPNGAGKTTTLNACAGAVPLAGGRVELLGADVTGWSPSRRARLGLGRTFQRFALCDSMSVRENVALSVEARASGASPWRCFAAPRAQRTAMDERAAQAMATCTVEHLADRRTGSLSTGERRLVELARAVAGGFAVLLLDEPSSGLDPSETEGFAQVVARVVADGDTSVLLVEHDMTLVRALCEYLYVLDFGEYLCEGPTEAVLADDRVRRAYLGTIEEAEVGA